MGLSVSLETNGTSPKATLAKGAELHHLIQQLKDMGAPIYEPATLTDDHRGFIGLVYEDGCIQRFPVDDCYRYYANQDFLNLFKGKQLACL